MSIESARDLEGISVAGRVVARALDAMAREVQPEPPTVANYFDPFQKDMLTEGLVITIEPLISQRRTRLRQCEDGWTLKTANGCLAAHHEHTVIVTNGDPVIVTTL